MTPEQINDIRQWAHGNWQRGFTLQGEIKRGIGYVDDLLDELDTRTAALTACVEALRGIYCRWGGQRRAAIEALRQGETALGMEHEEIR